MTTRRPYHGLLRSILFFDGVEIRDFFDVVACDVLRIGQRSSSAPRWQVDSF